MKTFHKAILLTILGILLIVYFSFYFQRGIIVDQKFMRMTSHELSRTFTGEENGLEVEVHIEDGEGEGKKKIVYTGNNISRNFELQYWYLDEYRYTINFFEDKELIFQGQYEMRYLTDNCTSLNFRDNEGYPYVGITSLGGKENQDIKLNCNLVKIALEDYNITNRGNFVYMSLAVILLLIVAIDIISPKLFFGLRLKGMVKEPEMSDFYTDTQVLKRIITSFISVSLLLVSLFY